ncbi:hypothetical protein Taro_001840 [Colocasia esculenta]|uniref:Putative plant transposon protein domain-containing protein n=1 Tax=Colocasia esculenta TaxID=4460 RepID=A0A843TES8_COLES|nr:hypothetical protein [Colocasia esculenta]
MALSASSGVDTRPSSQRTQLTGLYSVSTQPQVVSTLDPVLRGPVCQTGTVPHRGARSRAHAKPIAVEEQPVERRSKCRHDPTQQPGGSSASPTPSKRGRASSSSRGPSQRGSAHPRRKILASSPDVSEDSSSTSSESSQPSEETPSKLASEGKLILKPRAVDLEDNALATAFPQICQYFNFQTWLPFISEFKTIYPKLVQEFYSNLECTPDGYQSDVKGVLIDLPIELAATLFRIPAEGADYHDFTFDLHEAYSILTGLPSDETDPKQTYVSKFNTNTFPPVLRLIHHILTTIITPQGCGRDRLTDIQRFIIYCMKKDIKVNLNVIMYQIIGETTRKDLHRSLPYTAHLTSVFWHFGVFLENELAQSIPKSNIYCFKHLKKFMGFRLDGDQVRSGPAVVQAPVAPEVVPPPEVPQSPTHEDQPPVVNEAPIPQDVPQTPPFQTSSPLLPKVEIPSFTPHYQASASASIGGPYVPPELYSFLNNKFDTITSSILQMSESFELRIQRLENSVNAQFIKQKEAADHATQRFNRLIGTLADASLELKEHQETLEKVLQGILANSQTNLFNSQEAVSQISKTRLSFAHMVDDLEGMKNLTAHIDNEMSILKKELSNINKHRIASSSSGSQPISAELSAFQSNMYENSQRLEELLHTRLSTMQTQLRSNLAAMESRLKTIESILLPLPPPPPPA